MRIDIILPVNNPDILAEKDIEKLNLPNYIKCNIKLPNNKLLEITNQEEEEMAKPSIIESTIEAEKNGADAIIIYCFGEPGVDEARKLTDIPVLGIAAPAMHIARQLGKKFSVIASVDAHCPLIENLAEKFGLKDSISKSLSLNISPNNFNDDSLLIDIILNKAEDFIVNQKVDTFILGCGSMKLKSKMIKKAIQNKFGYNTQIVDPLPVSIYTAITMVHSDLS